jgi:hypothetical protein
MSIRGISGFSSMIRDYAETRNGRISWHDYLDLFISLAGKKKRCIRRCDNQPFAEMTDKDTGKQFALYKGRSAHCHNLQKWDGAFPILGQDRRPYVTIPAKDCKACEFHEPKVPYSRLRKYAACKWFRENSGMKSPLAMMSDALNDAAEMLK